MNKILALMLMLATTATAAFAKDKEPSPTTHSDVQKIKLLQAYKAEADSTIEALSFQLQAAQAQLQSTMKARRAAFDAALKEYYDSVGINPKEGTLDWRTLEITKVEKPPAPPEAKAPVAPDAEPKKELK